MATYPDFEEWLALLNAHGVDCLIVGAHALAHHGAPRYAGDLEILVHPDEDNARRIVAALADFGFASLGLTVEYFCVPDRAVQLGVPPVRIDLLTSLTGVGWDEAATGVPGRYGNVPVAYLGRAQFIANKRAIGRARDLADIEALGEKP